MRVTPFPILLFFGALVFGCQGEPNAPSDPSRGVDLTAGGCKSTEFTAASAVYSSSKVRNTKLTACKTIEGLVKRGQVSKAELEIDKLLAAISSDYHESTAALVTVPPSTSVEQSVAIYIGAACGLAPLDDSDCLVPYDVNESGGIDGEDLDGWISAGPLTGTSEELDTGLLQNALFAFGVEGGPAFVTVAQRAATGVDGPCPEEFAHDCQDDIFDVDVDGVFTSVTVASCVQFAVSERHAHCPPGAPCEFGQVADHQLTGLACDALGYHEMDLFGKFAYQATRPAQWVIHATPAYAAGTSTKFGAFSPIVLADLTERTRGVDCIISSSQFNAGSEGSTCRVLRNGNQIAQCVTTANGSNSSSCRLNPPVPGDITVVVTVAKTGGAGAYNATSLPFTLGPDDPALNAEPNFKQVCFSMTPPTASQLTCP